MMNTDTIKEVLLMGPGPSLPYDEVLKALARPTLGHLDAQFILIMDDIKRMLKELFCTNNDFTVPVSGTGSAGMETVFVNLIERGDRVLILKNGVFGERMEDVASRLGAEVDSLSFTWGEPVDPQRVKEALEKKSYRIVAMVHAETSTGVENPASEVGELVADHGALYILDTVTSLGGMPVLIDQWNVDASYSGTQKCLSTPPGLSPVTFSQRAMDKLLSRESKVPNWYLDMSMVAGYWAGKKRAYHHTAPINMLYGLHKALSLILDEGLPEVHERHRRAHEALCEGLGRLGIELSVSEGHRLPMLNAVRIPEGIDDASGRALLRDRYSIEIGGGLGAAAGKLWRIGLMGNTARLEHVRRLLGALDELLNG